MKRGDYAALTLFFIQAACVFYRALHIPPNLPGLGEHYMQIALTPLSESLSAIRTLGYPAFHALMNHYGWGVESYPTFQMMALIPCVFVLWWGLRAYGLTGLAALTAVSPLLWLVPVELIMPETLAKCFAIASIGFVLWAAGTRRTIAYIGLAISLFLAYQMRPAFLFLVGFLPVLWALLYLRRWTWRNQARFLRNGAALSLACAMPLILFCLVRLIVVGHFGLVSFAGQNTAGIAIEMLDPATITKLPPEDKPLALLLERSRVAWPAPRFLDKRRGVGDWNAAVTQYAANVNRIARTVQARFPAGTGSDNVAQDKTLNRLSMRLFRDNPDLYFAWLRSAATESAKVTATLILGADHDFGLGLGESYAQWCLLILAALTLASWPLERRAFGEGSRPHFTRAVTVVTAIALLFLGCKLFLVILVEPPIARYVQAAAMLLPCLLSALYWDRIVVLTAGLLRKPQWYGQCYAAYPMIPDLYQPLPWCAALARIRPGKRGAAAVVALLLVLSLALGWATRDNRLFAALAEDYDQARAALLDGEPPIAWRSHSGATLLHYAALHGDAELTARLLQAGAAVDSATPDGAQPLHWAAMENAAGATIAQLLDAGARPDAAGPLGLTPLHLAALSGNGDAMDTLVSHESDLNAKTSGGIAPLHIAQSPEIARRLIDLGATVDITDWSGATPFSWAHTRALASLLIEHGADINAKETWRTFVRQCTALHKAAYQGDLDTARWLLEKGADPDAGDISNLSPLFYAIWRNDIPMARLLLDQDAQINHEGHWYAFKRGVTDDRFTGIYAKTIGRHPNREQIGAVVPDRDPIRPLDWAAFLGRSEIIELLINRGADGNPHPDTGRSPVDWAQLASREDTARLIRKVLASRAPAPAKTPALPVETEETLATPELGTTSTDPRAELRAALEVEARAFFAGDPNILEAHDGFLFTRQACTYMLETDFLYATPGDPDSGPSPAMASIVDINQQLAARGIHLIVIPVPLAIEVYTDAFFPGWDIQEPSQPARGAFIDALREAGVDAMDLLPQFLQHRKTQPDTDLYLEADGHWNSVAIGIAVSRIREKLDAIDLANIAPPEKTTYKLAPYRHHVVRSHIAKRLPPERQGPYQDLYWDVTRVLNPDGSPYNGDDESKLLVAGDSFTVIFREMHGDLSARLAAEMGYPVASYQGLAAGPIIPRVLARKGKSYIDKRKVIVWVFSASYLRPLGMDQWAPLTLP